MRGIIRTNRWAPVPACVVVFAAGFLFSASAASGQLNRRVEAVGRAAGTGVKAHDEALQDAKRKAVEQACGLFINAQSQTDNYQLVKDRILADVLGYIVEFREVEDWEKDGVTFAKISAVVSTAKFEDDWAKFAQLREDMDNPRMMIVITEDNDVDDPRPPRINGICQSKLERFFADKDVELVDETIARRTLERDLKQATLDGDTDRLRALATRLSADVLVYGQAEARAGGTVLIGEQTWYRWDITLTVRAVQADSARVLIGDTYRLDKPFLTPSAACGDEAFVRLAEQVAPRVLSDIAEAWRRRATSHRVVLVEFQGCSRSEFRNVITPALIALRGVAQGAEGVKIRQFNNNTITAELYWAFDINKLADAIEELALDRMRFEITGQEANRLNVKIYK